MDTVCFVSPRYPPYIGGVETHVSELATRAKARFGRVSVVTTDPLGHLPAFEDDGVHPRIYRVRSFAPRENYHFPSPARLYRCLRDSNPRILHLHSLHDIPAPLAAMMKGNSSLVLTPHFHGRMYSRLGGIFSAAYRSLLRKIIYRVSALVCVSRFEARLVAEALPGSEEKIQVIPNGVDEDLLQNYSWQQPDVPRILYVGRLERYKNVDKIIRAFAALRAGNARLRLAVVGKGPYKEELRGLARDLQLGEEVMWLEGVDKAELSELYCSSSVVILPSELEAFGLVAAEAISLGVPTLVANSSALSEFVEAGLALGLKVPIGEEDLMKKISEVLANPDSHSFRGRHELIQPWRGVADKTFRLYESLL